MTSQTLLTTIPNRAGDECRLPPMWKYGESVSKSNLSSGMYRLKYCLKGPLNPKQPTNQVKPKTTNQPTISGRLPDRGRKRRERIEESKNVQTSPTRTSSKRNRPLPYYHTKCRTPGHWKFTQDHRTTRPPPRKKRKMMDEGWLYWV